MSYDNLIINATNPDFRLNYIVHETVMAEFVSPLLDRDFGPEYIAVPIGLNQSLHRFALIQPARLNSALSR